MLKIKDGNTQNPKVNWDTKTADCYCSKCMTEKSNFAFFDVMKFDGANFIFSSLFFDCGCLYTTIYPMDGMEPECAILKKMLISGSNDRERVKNLEKEIAELKQKIGGN